SLRTSAKPSRTYSATLRLLYLPLPPVIESKQLLSRRVEVTKPEFTLQAAARPVSPGQDLEVRLLHKQGDTVLEEKEIPSPWTMNQRFAKLRLGDNVIEVVAVNQGALPAYRDFETTRQALTVTYQRN